MRPVGKTVKAVRHAEKPNKALNPTGNKPAS